MVSYLWTVNISAQFTMELQPIDIATPPPLPNPCHDLCSQTRCCATNYCHESYSNYGNYMRGRSTNKEVCKVVDMVCNLVACINDGSIPYGSIYQSAGSDQDNQVVVKGPLHALQNVVTPRVRGSSLTLHSSSGLHIKSDQQVIHMTLGDTETGSGVANKMVTAVKDDSSPQTYKLTVSNINDMPEIQALQATIDNLNARVLALEAQIGQS